MDNALYTRAAPRAWRGTLAQKFRAAFSTYRMFKTAHFLINLVASQIFLTKKIQALP